MNINPNHPITETCAKADRRSNFLRRQCELNGHVTRRDLDLVEAGPATYIPDHILFGACLEYVFDCGCAAYISLGGTKVL